MAKFKNLTQSQIKTLLLLKSEDVNLGLLKNLFAATDKAEAQIDFNGRFMISDELLDKMESKCIRLKKKGEEETSAGRFIVNLFLLSNPELKTRMSYINKAFDSGTIVGVQNQLSTLLIEKSIDNEVMEDFINREQWIGFSLASIAGPSMDRSIMVPLDKVKKRKEELFKKYEKEIKAKDVATISKIEKELLAIAKEELERQDTAGMRIYESGGRGKFGKFIACL